MTDTLFENYRAELIDRIQAKRADDGLITTDLPSLSFYCSSTASEFATVIYEPSLCLVLQGSKEVVLGDEIYTLDDSSKYLLVSVHVPTRVRIKEASSKESYVALKLTFTMEDIFEVMKDIHTTMPIINPSTEAGLCFGELKKVIDPLTRLVRLLDNPSSLKFMSSMIRKANLSFYM